MYGSEGHKSSFPAMMSKYWTLLRSENPKATEADARAETNAGYLKVDRGDNDGGSRRSVKQNSKGQFQVSYAYLL
jgi:hypothetical protein